jgi:hypothetical protein
MKRISFLIIFFIFNNACFDWDWMDYSKPMREWDVPGVYKANFGETKTNWIEFLSDSTYISHYKSKIGQEYVDTGYWRFYFLEPGSYQINLYNFRNRYPAICFDYPGRERDMKNPYIDTTIIGMPIRRYDDGVVIRYCPQKGWNYVKKTK